MMNHQSVTHSVRYLCRYRAARAAKNDKYQVWSHLNKAVHSSNTNTNTDLMFDNLRKTVKMSHLVGAPTTAT